MYRSASFRLGWIFVTLLLLVSASLAAVDPVLAQPSNAQVIELTASGPLTPAMAEYLSRGLQIAERENAELVVFHLNTPGGSIDLMNRMVQIIRSSRVPVAVYVSPRGAMAGSAGTMLTLAGHVAAMAPETAIGAASPVGGAGEDLEETEAAKTRNILKATIRSLASQRGEQAVRLAERTIDEAAAASAEEALAAGLIDFIAVDVGDLLRQVDGFTVRLEEEERPLNTAQAYVQPVRPTFIEQVLALLTNPNIVLILINIGVISILIELSSPGGWVAGFIGVVCLALATYGLGILPVNWFGVVFLALAFVLFALDFQAPTHGALTAAGVGSLIVGALVLFNSPAVPDFGRVSIPLVLATSLATGGLFFGVMLFALRAQKVPVLTGQERLVGRVGVARTGLSPAGLVQLSGEQWSAELAEGEPPIQAGERVRVARVEGLKLIVQRAPDPSTPIP